MAKKVLKFGGTSVGSIERIIHAAKIVKKEHFLIKPIKILILISCFFHFELTVILFLFVLKLMYSLLPF